MPTAELAYLRQSQTMYTALHDNLSGFFTVPFDMLSTWETQNAALDQAFTYISDGIAGGEGDKMTAMNDLKITLILALAYVNRLMLLNQRQAVAIATAAHMEIAGRGSHEIQDIAVKLGKASGQIIIRCKRPMEGLTKLQTTYFVEVSYDGGNTFVPGDPSHPAIVVIDGLTPNKSVVFRQRTWTKNGWSDWAVSKPITPY